MPASSRTFPVRDFFALLVLLLGVFGCSGNPEPRARENVEPSIATPPPFPEDTARRVPHGEVFPVMLGIDVLQSEGFAAVKGKRLGLLTHPAGVNRYGVSTINLLRGAPGVKLVALYGPEHGIYGNAPAEAVVGDTIDRRTGLPVYSLYGKFRRPVKSQLKGIDAMVIDLQDIGSRSYTFISAMKLTMEACFENNIEVIVLDRPNPLGGLKVSGPLLDANLISYVGEFRVPYVHGLTIGELALMAKEAPGVLNVPDAVRARGKLVVVPMRGWRRAMRWPDTGLTWIPTSPYIPDFAAVEGYPMVGLGTYADPPRIDTGFRHGVGKLYPFRGLSHRTEKIEVLQKDLRALDLPGLQFRRISAPNRHGKPATGLYIEIADYDEWQPTDLNFYLMKLACQFDPHNPFRPAKGRDFSGFLHHMGSAEFLRALQRDGARVNVPAFLAEWRKRDAIYQRESKRYWLYR